MTRARSEWLSLLDDLYRGWGGRWSSPSERVEIADPATLGAERRMRADVLSRAPHASGRST